MSSARRLLTERLIIATATQQHLLVELDDPQKLGPLLGADVPGSWPPGPTGDADLRAALARVADTRGDLGWGMRYVVLRKGPAGRPVLIGRVTLGGRPSDGETTIECALVPAFSGHGYGREAAGRLVDWALDHREVERVVATAAASQDGWIAALRELGFAGQGDALDGVELHADPAQTASTEDARFVRTRAAWLRDSVALRRGATLVPRPASEVIAGIPALATEVFERLLKEPLRDPDDLTREVRLYVDILANAAADTPSVDHELGRDIARTCEGLLMAISEATPEHTRRQIQAAARYFVTEDDGDSDLEIGGLDEDAAVANAVAEHLGRSDLLCDHD